MAASKHPLARLGHIRDEIVQLTAALDGATYEVFAENYVLRRTDEHAVVMISEAVKALSPSFTDHHAGRPTGTRSAASGICCGMTTSRSIPGSYGEWSRIGYRS